MKPEHFIREYGVDKAREIVEGIPSKYMECYYSTLCYCTKAKKYSDRFNPRIELVNMADLKRLVESLDLVEKLGGYGKCKFYMTGMKLNKCDSVKCPKTGLIVSRAALEIAINDYRESIYGGGENA